MTKQKYLIAWEKWADPYGENIEDIEWPGCFGEANNILEDNKEQIYKDQDTEDEDESENWPDDDNYMSKMLKSSKPGFMKKPIRLLMTPMGVVPLTEYSTPSKVFNFWVGHTNFPITSEVYEIIDNSPGVEVLTLFSKYRLRVGVGKVFDTMKTLKNINDSLNNYLRPPKQSKKTNIVKKPSSPFNIFDHRQSDA